MDIKLVAFDMDGTLLNKNKEVEKEEIKALKDLVNKGIKVVLCTGRPLFGTVPIYKTLELDEKEGYIIVNNGCTVHKTSDFSVVDYRDLLKEEIKELYEESKNFDVDFTLFDDNHYFYVGEEKEEANEKTRFDSTLVYVDLTKINIDEAISGKYKMYETMFVGEPENVDKVQEKIVKKLEGKYSFTRSQDYILEVLPVDADKGKALKRLAEKLGIKREEVAAFGDGNNDVEMLQYAGLSIVMGNGTEMAKKAAKYETDTNDKNGVSKGIYKYILK